MEYAFAIVWVAALLTIMLSIIATRCERFGHRRGYRSAERDLIERHRFDRRFAAYEHIHVVHASREIVEDARQQLITQARGAAGRSATPPPP